jgi:hypothetical protein
MVRVTRLIPRRRDAHPSARRRHPFRLPQILPQLRIARMPNPPVLVQPQQLRRHRLRYAYALTLAPVPADGMGRRHGGRKINPANPRIWWWRGRGNNAIEEYSVVSPIEILLDYFELPIKRIVAVNTGTYWQSFVYVESTPKPPIGLYERDPKSQAKEMELFGYLLEEFGLYKGRPVTRAEYDDGAAVIDGKPQPIPGAVLRLRLVTPYNFLIASHESPINNSHFDARADEMLNGILKNTCSIQDLVNEVKKLPKRDRFDGYAS